MTVLPPEAEQLAIRRVTPKTQETDLHNGARLPAELIEGIGDKATMEIQELAAQKLSKDDKQDILKTINDALEDEQEKRTAADEQLQANIIGEAETRQAHDDQLQLNISNEAQERQNQDTLLQQHIDEEATARAQADSGFHNEVLEEAAVRYQADNNLDIKKQDRLPDEIHPLIDSTGKINPAYIPDTILGAVKYGGTFNGQGVINASSLAPELQGVMIDTIDTSKYLGFYFIANAEFTFSDGTEDISYDTGDKAICHGNHTPKWAKVDNTDAVESVNGKKGAVTLTKGDINLYNVLNKEQVPAEEKGQPSGVPTLDEEGKIPFSQIPNIATHGFGVFKFYIPQEGPKTKHLILRYPKTTEPPDIFIDRDQDSPKRGHLIWKTECAGDLDFGEVAMPLVEIEAIIGAEAQSRQTADEQLATYIGSEAKTRQTADEQLQTSMGDLSQLETGANDNLVNAINEAGAVQTVDGISPENKNVKLRYSLTRAEFAALKESNGGKAPAGRYIISDGTIDEEA